MKTLDAKWYDEFSRIMLEDLKYTSLRGDVAQCILDYLREVNGMSPLIDLNKLEDYVRVRANLSRREWKDHR